jgi:23S rRNA pseudouridine1911/1915/1917 synthase
MDTPQGRATAGGPLTLTAERDGRLDAVLAQGFPDMSRARLQRLIAAGHVLVNGESARKSGQVHEGDVLVLDVPETPHPAVAVAFDLSILYEDDALLVVDKPAGLAVHGAPGDTGPSVASWFLAHYGAEAGAFDAERPGIVHRLDKDTTGVLLMAKTPSAQAALSAAFEARTTHKTYLAVVDAVPSRERAVIDAGIARHPGDRTRMAIAKNGRESRTAYETLGADGQRALLLVTPETGRTHQIRVHLAAVGCAVVDDGVYGKRRPGDSGRQLLHAYRLSVPHPAGGTLEVTAPLPADMVAAVRSMGLDSLASRYSQPAPPVRTV